MNPDSTFDFNAKYCFWLLLTKCPGVGERESFSPADPGTSKRGHFICRYCGWEERSRIIQQNKTCHIKYSRKHNQKAKIWGEKEITIYSLLNSREWIFSLSVQKWFEWCQARRELQQTPVQDPHSCWSQTVSSGTEESRERRCEHNGLVEDCEIAVCQGKTRGQLWAPIAERVGRDSWKEAPSTRASERLSCGLRSELLSVRLNWSGLLTRTQSLLLSVSWFFTHVLKLS